MRELTENRYARQSHAFPSDRRRASALAVFCAEDNPIMGGILLAGALAMGVPIVGYDFHGPSVGPSRKKPHWLLGEYPELVTALNPEVNYQFLDPDVPAADLPFVLENRANPWIVVLIYRPARARAILMTLTKIGVTAPVLLVLSGPGGLVVDRHSHPASALESASNVPAAAVSPGTPELAIAAAGIILNEIMLAEREPESPSRTVGFYSLHQRRRVRIGGGSVSDRFGEIAAGPGGPTGSFAGRNLILVGAGALGNWSVIPLVLGGLRELVIYDGDGEVELHNLNRQILLAGGVGQDRAKVDVLAEELSALDRAGNYRGITKFIKSPDDLTVLGDADAMLCVTDNDESRLVCDEARRQVGVLFATAGSSAVGGQAIVRSPRQGCLRCLGLSSKAGEAANDSQSCSLVQSDAVVGTNMTAAGMMVSELREALAGREPANIRFAGDSRRGNRLVRMISNAPCPHLDLAGVAAK